MSDYDIQNIVDVLEMEDYYDARPWHTPILQDVDTGESFVIQDIFIDEDDDVVFKIKHL